MELVQRILAKFGHSLGLPSNYSFLKKIGAGAEGEVWLCLDDAAQTVAAVKLIPRGSPAWKLDMAGRELRMLVQLGSGHMNIMRPLEVVLTSKHLALIAEYVPGGSLSDYLARHAATEDVARYFFKQMLSALAFCHNRKVVFRDIKPANVLVTGTNPPFLKLCDFGLADSWKNRPEPLFKTLVGTPGYMSPEIMSGFCSEAAAALERKSAAAVSTPSCGAGRSKSSHAGKEAAAAAPAGTAAAAAAAASGDGGAAAGSEAADGTVLVPTYDGTEADVYSLGVLLVVMMMRHMPWNYDAFAERLPPLEAMQRLYQLQVVRKVNWKDATSKADKLSAPLSALLDRMLEPDPAKRATLQEVAASDWVNMPLPPKLQCALEVLADQQKAREQLAAEGHGVSEAVVAARLQQLQEMLKAAQTVDKGFKLQSRLVLTHRPGARKPA